MNINKWCDNMMMNDGWMMINDDDEWMIWYESMIINEW